MYQNVFQPVLSLTKSPITVGGLCSIKLFKWEDVLIWPKINPFTGIIASAIQLKPGKSIYFLQAAEKDRTFSEDEKFGTEGPWFDISVTGILTGSSVSNTLSLKSMLFHKWGLIVEDRNGDARLIGDADGGATLSYNYSSGDAYSSRKRQVKFNWQYPMPAPVYIAQAFTITIGGVTITAGSLTLIMRFKVGAAGAPMMDGDTLLTIASIKNKNILLLADGMALINDDGSGQVDFTGSIIRHIEKPFLSDQIVFIGGVVQNEIIEIYAFS